jgi:hypothetical protein
MLQQPEYNTIDQYGTPMLIQMKSHVDWNVIHPALRRIHMVGKKFQEQYVRRTRYYIFL